MPQQKKITLAIITLVSVVFIAVIFTQKNTSKQDWVTSQNKISQPQTEANLPSNSSTITDQKSQPAEHTSVETHPGSNELPRDTIIIGTFGKYHGIVYSKGNELWQYTLASSTQPELLSTSKGTIKELVISPDNQWLAYTYQDGQFDFSQLGGVAGECIAEHGTSLIVRSLTTNKEQSIAHAVERRDDEKLRIHRNASPLGQKKRPEGHRASCA